MVYNTKWFEDVKPRQSATADAPPAASIALDAATGAVVTTSHRSFRRVPSR